uniref:Uncharacterized protein n=1 Tax=Moniliophthora roreri TaxID=221103 RepID=A0A0W0EUS3_MONRR
MPQTAPAKVKKSGAPKAKGAESNNVSDIREKIKTFLASQGMIKGHSGSGSSRTSTQHQPEEDQRQEPATLKLANEGYSSSASESPPPNLLVLSEDVRHHSQVSNVRGEEWAPYGPPPSSSYGPHPLLRHSPQPTPRQGTTPPPASFQPQENVYDPYLLQQQSNNTLAAPWTPPPAQSSAIPLFASSYGSSYAYAPDDDMDTYAFDASNPSVNSTSGVLTIPPVIYGSGATDELIHHYIAQVLEKQYLLADDPISKIMLNAIQSGFARSSAQLLASVHFQRTKSSPFTITSSTIAERYALLQEVLKKSSHNDNDAIGALTVVSSFLFDGGRGDWPPWLELSIEHGRRILQNSRYLNVKDAMINCSETERFIVKTAIWFDVLASVTTLQAPRFLDVINYLFDPNNTSSITSTEEGEQEALSMMNIMGAEGRVIWAWAQTSNLAQRKASLAERGALDMTLLVQKANEIEGCLATPAPRPFPEKNIHRYLVSEVFRNAARLYLLTVLHGDFPNVPAVRYAVDGTVNSLMKAGQYSKEVQEAVVRSTVVAVFMCGCLALTEEKKKQTMGVLTDQGTWGNAKGVGDVMNQVWDERHKLPAKEPVPWRQILNKNQLLLV